MGKFRRRVVWLMLIGLLIYASGFAVFVVVLPKPFLAIPPVDGVVVFTGGSNRVATGLAALRDGFSGEVLISGVHPDVRIDELPGGRDLDDAARQRVSLDYVSATTRENVEQTLRWADSHNMRRIGVMTSTYHTLRCRILFGMRRPDVDIVMLPVQPVDGGVRFLWREYNKVLVAPLLR